MKPIKFFVFLESFTGMAPPPPHQYKLLVTDSGKFVKTDSGLFVAVLTTL